MLVRNLYGLRIPVVRPRTVAVKPTETCCGPVKAESLSIRRSPGLDLHSQEAEHLSLDATRLSRTGTTSSSVRLRMRQSVMTGTRLQRSRFLNQRLQYPLVVQGFNSKQNFIYNS